jgi:chromosome segregation ATPase
MDAIRKKMHSLKLETDAFKATCTRLEEEAAENNKASDKNDCVIRDLSKKIGGIEGHFEEALEGMNKTNTALAEKEKLWKTAEEDVGAVSRRIVLLEYEAKDADGRLGDTVYKLAFKSKEADKILKKVRHFESKNMSCEMTIEEQEKDLREANAIVHDSEKKLDEVSRSFSVMEDMLKRSTERADLADSRLAKIEEELRAVGDNMHLLEVAEEKALTREDKYKEQVRLIMVRLKAADTRAEYGEMNITKLNCRIDDIEDEIIREKLKIQKVSDELGDTFDDMLVNY